MENILANVLNGNSGQKKKLSSNERSSKNAKERADTDFNAPNGSRNIPFQSQEFEHDGCRHFVDF